MKRTKKSASPKHAPQKSTLRDAVLKSLDQDKAVDIVCIDLTGKTSIADYMVVATGTSSRHVAAMAEKLKTRLSKEGIKPRIEGKSTGDWVVVDAIDVIVHLFREEVREFYNLEKLWQADLATTDVTLYKSL